MWLAGNCILLVLLTLARVDGMDYFSNMVSSPAEGNLNHDNIDLRGLGRFFSKIFGPPKDRPSGGMPGGNNGVGDGGMPGGNNGVGDGGMPGGNNGVGDGGMPGGNNGVGDGGMPGGNNGVGDGGMPGGNNGVGDGGMPGLERMLGMLKGIAEKLGTGAMPGGMEGALGPMGMLQVQPWMAMLEDDLQPLSYTVPAYLSAVGPSISIYDKIDFDAIGPMIQQELKIGIQQEFPPEKIARVIAPIVYRLRAGCTTNVLQRLISVGFTRWVNKRMDTVSSSLMSAAPREDVDSLVGAIKKEVMGEVNRTIFGQEFQEFDEMLNFMLMAVRWNLRSSRANGTTEEAMNTTTDGTSIVFPLLKYLLQCKTRQSFLQELLTRIATLKRRVIFARPWPFTARIMRTLFPCGDMGQIPNKPEMVYKIFQGTSYALGIIQKELGKMIWNVERAIIFGDDEEIANIFPLFLGNQTGQVMQTLARIRSADGPPPVFPSPPPTPSGPDFDQNGTWDYNPLGYGSKRNNPPPPAGNGTRDGPPPAGNGTRDGPPPAGNGTRDGPPPAGNGTRDDASRPPSEQKSNSEKLFTLLKRNARTHGSL